MRSSGKLLLTDRRLIFDPTEDVGPKPKGSSSRTWGVFASEKSLGMKVDRGGALLADISRVEAIPGELPNMRVVLNDGIEVTFAVQARLFNPPGAKTRERNCVARDEAVQSIDAALRRREQG